MLTPIKEKLCCLCALCVLGVKRGSGRRDIDSDMGSWWAVCGEQVDWLQGKEKTDGHIDTGGHD